MAGPGIVYHNITTSTGVTYALACWVPDTAIPDVGAVAAGIQLASNGSPLVLLKTTSTPFTCPNAVLHAAGTNLSDNSTAGSVTKLQFTMATTSGVIRRLKIRKNGLLSTPTIRMWMWDTTFTVASGDNVAFSQPLVNLLGQADVGLTNLGTDCVTGTANIDVPFSNQTVYGLLQLVTSYTVGAAEQFTVDLWYEAR